MKDWTHRVKVTSSMWRSFSDTLRSKLDRSAVLNHTVARAREITARDHGAAVAKQFKNAADRYAKPGGDPEWFKRCERGVKGSAADPKAVCGSLLRRKYNAYYGKAEGGKMIVAAQQKGKRHVKAKKKVKQWWAQDRRGKTALDGKIVRIAQGK